MTEREYVCAYPRCLHHGVKVKASDAVVINKKRYHWDCAKTKQQLEYIRNYYFENIDGTVNFAILSKVLNTLVFEDGLDIDFVKFAIEYYGKYKMKIKSPFYLTYLKKNKMLKNKWLNSTRQG